MLILTPHNLTWLLSKCRRGELKISYISFVSQYKYQTENQNYNKKNQQQNS